jgi:hypothetical protein
VRGEIAGVIPHQLWKRLERKYAQDHQTKTPCKLPWTHIIKRASLISLSVTGIHKEL